ncbi:MAG: hypothetical protein OXC62_01835 [Aestuariivita sp.]|nr:hypothetical protein [Aestuariivita sp.]
MKKFKRGGIGGDFSAFRSCGNTARITVDDIMRIIHFQSMDTPPDNYELDKRLAVLWRSA